MDARVSGQVHSGGSARRSGRGAGYLTPEAMESMTAVMKIGAEYAEEVKTLRARVAELEERLLMMCVAQINGAELQQ